MSEIEKPTILIVDDEKSIREVLGKILLLEQYDVRGAESGEVALALLGSKPADVVILDVRLPGMDGLVALRKIKETYPSTEVIMISGCASLNDAVQAVRLGAFDFLQKPLNRDRVLSTVHGAMQSITETCPHCGGHGKRKKYLGRR